MPLFGKKRVQANPGAESLNRILMAGLVGEAFRTAIQERFPLEPSFWVNRAAQKLPWDEGPQVVEAVRSFPAPLDEEHEVYAVVNQLAEPLERAERGLLSPDQALKLHETVTLVIRATILAAVRWLERMHPAAFEGKTEDEADRSGFSLFSVEMNSFEQMLLHSKMTGRDVSLLEAVGGMCFNVLEVRQKWHSEFVKQSQSR